MKYKLEEQDGVYFLDVYLNDTLENKTYEYGTAVFDTKRNTYYLLPAESKKTELTESFINVMEILFLKDLVPRFDLTSMVGFSVPFIKKGSRTGELAHDSKDKLIALFEQNDIQYLTKSETDDKKYTHLLTEYHKGYYPEEKMLHI